MNRQDYLCHYGVLGMKWGVRRTPEQLGRHVIKRGTKMYRATTDSAEKTSGSKYVTYLDPDRDLYRGSYADGLKYQKGLDKSAALYEKSYRLTHDIVVPSRKELMNSYNEVFQKNPKLLKRVLNEYSGMIADRFEKEDWAYSYADLQPTNNSKKSFYDNLLEAYDKWPVERKRIAEQRTNELLDKYSVGSINAIFSEVVRSVGTSDELRKSIIENLSSKGYNAMVDEASVGGHGTAKEGVDPILVFDSSKSLDDVGTIKINEKQQRKAAARYNKWNRTANRHRGEW